MSTMWVNVDDTGGVPSQPRPDAVAPPHWRLEAIASLGRPHDLTVSADGLQAAFVLDQDDRSDIWMIRTEGGGPRRITTGRAPHPYWEDTPPGISPGGTHIAHTEEGWVCVTATAGGPTRRIVEAGSPRWLDDRRLVVTIEREHVGRLCIVAVDDPWPAALTGADGSASGADIEPGGARIAYVHAPVEDRHTTEIRILDLSDGTVETVDSAPGFSSTGPVFSPDGRHLAYVSDRTGWNEVFVWSDGACRRLTHAERDFSALRWRRDGSGLVAIAARAGVADLVEVEMGTGSMSTVAVGGTWSDPFPTRDGIVAIHEDHATPPRIMAIGAGDRSDTVFQSIPAAITAAPHAAPRSVTFPSSDGLEIPGLLFTPASVGTRRPVIVYPHGGPTSHYGDEWDGHAQYFVDKGYGWLAVNFRGSTGYGLEFERAEHGRWGVDDTEDCLAAADYLASLEWVDPDRIGIFGASYGSYLAVAALARDPRRRFACGVAKYGDCDILTSWAQGDRVGLEDLERMMGHPSDNRSGYLEGSPVHRVSDIARPLLIAHGERDDRVHPRQSQQLVDALRLAGKTFEYVTYPTEGHGLLRREPQLHFYRRLERFLDWYLM